MSSPFPAMYPLHFAPNRLFRNKRDIVEEQKNQWQDQW